MPAKLVSPMILEKAKRFDPVMNKMLVKGRKSRGRQIVEGGKNVGFALVATTSKTATLAGGLSDQLIDNDKDNVKDKDKDKDKDKGCSNPCGFLVT